MLPFECNFLAKMLLNSSEEIFLYTYIYIYYDRGQECAYNHNIVIYYNIALRYIIHYKVVYTMQSKLIVLYSTKQYNA